MNNQWAMRLAEYKVGRIVLHLIAIKRHGHSKTHFQGIRRELVAMALPLLLLKTFQLLIIVAYLFFL